MGLGRVRDSLPPGRGGWGVLSVKRIPPWSDLKLTSSDLLLLEKLRRKHKNVVCVADKILGERWAVICAETVGDASRKGEELGAEQPDHSWDP